MDLEEAWIFGMWPKRLLIFEDRLEARDSELLREKAESREYARVRKVAVSGEGWLANLVVPILERKEVMRANTDLERSRDEG